MLRRLSATVTVTAVTLLTLAPAGIAHAQFPSATNGSYVYVNTTATNPEIDIVHSDGTSSQVLNAGASGIVYNGVDLDSTFTKLVYEIYDASTPSLSGVYTENVDGTSNTKVSSDNYNQGSAKWSADGTKLYVITANGLDLMNADGTNRSTIYTNTTTAEIHSVEVNPNGTTLAFSTFDTTGNTGSISTMTVTGGSITNVFTSAFGVDVDTNDWSPDGTTILFGDITSASSDGGHEYSVLANGTNKTTLLTNAAGPVAAGYSPDGTELIVIQGPAGGPYTLFTANADGTNLVASPVTNEAINGLDWAGTVLGAATTVPAPVAAASTTPSTTPGLPNAGKLRTSLPIALGLLGLVAAASIESARRLRRQA
ncbi:hypothetical protein HJC99_04185 [Candidatus Saccharibacteria bacterium]|nr:hypothetical protein [Candidatus Saccharibacteria bacterium]